MASHKIIIHYELVSSVAIIHLKATPTQLPITQQPFYIIQPKLSMQIGNCELQRQYFMGNHKLEVVHQEKDLGVVISNDLKVSQQCQQAYSKASRILGHINRTIEYRHTDILLRLYKSLVRPHLEYSISAWSPNYSKDKVTIERIQRRFTKMIASVRDLLYKKKLGLWSLEDKTCQS